MPTIEIDNVWLKKLIEKKLEALAGKVLLTKDKMGLLNDLRDIENLINKVE